MEVNIQTDLSVYMEAIYCTAKADAPVIYKIKWRDDAPPEAKEELLRRMREEGYDVQHG